MKHFIILREVNERVRKIYGEKVCDCYLYGSYARGDYHSESDVDIAIILDVSRYEISSTISVVSEIMSDLSLEHDVTVSITVQSYSLFKRLADDLPFYMNILKEGIRYE